MNWTGSHIYPHCPGHHQGYQTQETERSEGAMIGVVIQKPHRHFSQRKATYWAMMGMEVRPTRDHSSPREASQKGKGMGRVVGIGLSQSVALHCRTSHRHHHRYLENGWRATRWGLALPSSGQRQAPIPRNTSWQDIHFSSTLRRLVSYSEKVSSPLEEGESPTRRRRAPHPKKAGSQLEEGEFPNSKKEGS